MPNPLRSQLDDILHEARDKINSLAFPPSSIEEIPNSTYSPSEIMAKDIYIDDSFQDLAKSIYFPQLSTDDRRDFKIDVAENEMLLFKLPSLTIVSVSKKELRKILGKIIEDLDLNLTETLMSASNIQDTKQKKVIIKQLIKRLKTEPKKDMEEQLVNHDWLQKLIDDQIELNKNSFSFGHYDDNQKNKFKNVTKKKKKTSSTFSDRR